MKRGPPRAALGGMHAMLATVPSRVLPLREKQNAALLRRLWLTQQRGAECWKRFAPRVLCYPSCSRKWLLK